MARLDLKKCTVRIKGGGAGESLEIKIGDGSLDYTEQKNREYLLNRGLIDEVRDGDEVPMEVSMAFTWEFLRSDGSEAVTPEEALKRVGAAADWTSSDPDACAPYAVDIEVEYEPECSPTKSELYVFPDFRWENLAHSFKDASVSVSGKCNATEATVTRTTA